MRPLIGRLDAREAELAELRVENRLECLEHAESKKLAETMLKTLNEKCYELNGIKEFGEAKYSLKCAENSELRATITQIKAFADDAYSNKCAELDALKNQISEIGCAYALKCAENEEIRSALSAQSAEYAKMRAVAEQNEAKMIALEN